MFAGQGEGFVALLEAYDRFIQLANSNASEMPKTIIFKNETHKVLNYFGSGIEGIVIRVENTQGHISILKIIDSTHRSFLRILWDYYRMNRGATHPYTVIGVDFKNRIIQFADIRGIPMNVVRKRHAELGLPEQVLQRIWTQVAMEGYSGYEQNTLYDIDRRVFISIDPH